MQTAWATQLNPIIELPMNQGILLKGINLSTGNNVINHKLGRALQGWVISRPRAAATVFEPLTVNNTPKLTLNLTSSAPVIIDLWVF